MKVLAIAHNGEHAEFDDLAALERDDRKFEFIVYGEFVVLGVQGGNVGIEECVRQRGLKQSALLKSLWHPGPN